MPVGIEGGPVGLGRGTGVWQGWKDTSESSSWSECSNSLGDSVTSSVWGDGDLDPCTDVMALLAMFELLPSGL